MSPCPFCGDTPSLKTRTDEDIWTHDIVEWVWVGCEECDVGFEQPVTSDDKPSELWNRRSAPAQPSTYRCPCGVGDEPCPDDNGHPLCAQKDRLSRPTQPAAGTGKLSLERPFAVYHNGVEIGDKNGHVCTAENPEIAREVVATLQAHYGIPAQLQPGWRCFHCDEVFTDPKAAANHFGVDHAGNETLCQMAQVDGGIARVIADLAEELQRYRSEDNTSYREFYALGADHRAALIKEEQKGYDRGLADARAEASTLPSTTCGGGA
jgi:hypothetical protein